MAAEWFYQNKGQQSGPVDSRELLRLAEAGIVRPDTLVSQGTSNPWVRAERVQGLFRQSTPASSSSPGASPPGPPPLPPPLPESGAKNVPRPASIVSSSAETKIAASTFGLLRFIRGFCGVLFVMQIAGLLPVLTWLQQPDAVTDGIWVQVIIKVLALALFGSLFFGLRSIINRLHTMKYGVPHPALAENKWSL